MLPLLLAVTFLFSSLPISALAEGEAPADTDWAAMYGPGECLVFADFVPGADLIVGSSTHGVQLYLRQTGTTEVQPVPLTVTGSLPQGWTAREAPHTTFTFEDVDGMVTTVALAPYDALHDAVIINGDAVFYLIQGGMVFGITE